MCVCAWWCMMTCNFINWKDLAKYLKEGGLGTPCACLADFKTGELLLAFGLDPFQANIAFLP